MMRIHIVVLLTMFMAPLSAVADPEFFDEGPMAGNGYPFSESVRVGDILFISGQVGVDENNDLVEGGIAVETRQIMSNIGGALERRGLGFSDVVKCTVFLADVARSHPSIHTNHRLRVLHTRVMHDTCVHTGFVDWLRTHPVDDAG